MAFQYHGDGVLSKVRKDGRRVYFIQFWYRGRRLTEKVGLEPTWDVPKAIAHVATRRRSIDEDPSYVPPSVKRKAKASKVGRATFAAFAKKFKTDWGASHRSEKKFFTPMANRLAEEFGTIAMDKLTTGRLQAFVAARRRKVKASTVNHDIRFLKNMCNRALAWGYLQESPAAKLRLLEEGSAREVFLSQEESDRLLAGAPAHVKPIVQTALLTGMRRSEILGLTWDRVDLPGRRIVLRDTKNGEARVLPIGDDLKGVLGAIPRHVSHGYVFTYYGRPIKSLQGSWDEARDEADLGHVHFHDLRHTWASRQVAAGTSLYALMTLGGWKDIAMVRRYAHFAPDYMMAVANQMNGTAGVVGLVVGPSGPSGQPAEKKRAMTA